MTIEAVEKLIIEKLQTDIKDFEVIAIPSKVSEYELNHPNGAVVVKFDGSNYTAPAMEQQTKMVQFSITMITRDLRSNTGAYKLIEQVRQSMTRNLYICGFRFYTLSERCIDVIDDLWYYESIFLIPDIILVGE